MRLLFQSSHFILLFVIFSSCWMGCAYKKDPQQTQKDRLNSAAEKIQKSDYLEAEADLRDFLRENPDHARAKVVLASLYAHRSGLRIRDYFNLERVINSKPVVVDNFVQSSLTEALNQSSDEKIKKIGGSLKQLNELLIQANHWNQKINEMPTWNELQVRDLEAAIEILNTLDATRIDIEPEPSRRVTEGMILYRGVLKIYYFKYLWTTNQFLPIYSKSICKSTLQSLESRTDALADYIQSVLGDFAVGVPKSRADTLRTQADFRNSALQVRQWLRGIRSSKETVMTFQKYLQVVSGTAELKCEF